MIKQSIQSFTYYILGAAIAFAFQMIAAWYLGSAEFGKANYYYGFALTIFTFTSFGVQFYLPKYLHESSNPQQFVSKSFWTMTILFAVLSPFIGYLLSFFVSTGYVILILFLSYLMIIFGLFQAYHNGMFETQKSYLLYFCLQSIITFIFIILSLNFSNFLFFLLALLVGYFIVNGYEIFKLVTREITFDRNVVYLSLSFYIVQITNGLFTSMSRILQKEFGSFEMVGVLSVALVLGGMVTMFGAVIANVVMPDFSKAWSNKDHEKIRNFFYNATRINSYVIVPFAVFALINSEKILGLFGSSYAGGSTILWLILLSSFFASAVGPNGTLLNMSNNQHYEIINGILGLISAIIITIIFAPIFLWGVALAIAVSVSIQNFAKVIEVHKIFGFWQYKRNIFIYLCVMCSIESVFFFIVSCTIDNKIIWFIVNFGLLVTSVICNYYLSPESQDREIILNSLKYMRGKIFKQRY